MAKNQEISNKPVSDFVIGIYIFGFVSDFDIRISDLVFWRDINPRLCP